MCSAENRLLFWFLFFLPILVVITFVALFCVHKNPQIRHSVQVFLIIPFSGLVCSYYLHCLRFFFIYICRFCSLCYCALAQPSYSASYIFRTPQAFCALDNVQLISYVCSKLTIFETLTYHCMTILRCRDVSVI